MDEDPPSNQKRDPRFHNSSISQSGGKSKNSAIDSETLPDNYEKSETYSNFTGNGCNQTIQTTELTSYSVLGENDGYPNSVREFVLPSDECGNVTSEDLVFDTRLEFINEQSGKQSSTLYSDQRNQNEEAYSMTEVSPKDMTTYLPSKNFDLSTKKNIEIQMSPIRVNVACTLGEDSVANVEQSMEVELDDDPDDPIEETQSHDEHENPHCAEQEVVPSENVVLNTNEISKEWHDISMEGKTEQSASNDNVPGDRQETEEKQLDKEKEESKNDFSSNKVLPRSFSQDDADIDEGVDVSDEINAEFGEDASGGFSERQFSDEVENLPDIESGLPEESDVHDIYEGGNEDFSVADTQDNNGDGECDFYYSKADSVKNDSSVQDNQQSNEYEEITTIEFSLDESAAVGSDTPDETTVADEIKSVVNNSSTACDEMFHELSKTVNKNDIKNTNNFIGIEQCMDTTECVDVTNGTIEDDGKCEKVAVHMETKSKILNSITTDEETEALISYEDDKSEKLEENVNIFYPRSSEKMENITESMNESNENIDTISGNEIRHDKETILQCEDNTAYDIQSSTFLKNDTKENGDEGKKRNIDDSETDENFDAVEEMSGNIYICQNEENKIISNTTNFHAELNEIDQQEKMDNKVANYFKVAECSFKEATTSNEEPECSIKAMGTRNISTISEPNSEQIDKRDKICDKNINSSPPETPKILSPRKGIKVEEDEIETAIGSVQFEDELAESNEGYEDSISKKGKIQILIEEREIEMGTEFASSKQLSSPPDGRTDVCDHDSEENQKPLALLKAIENKECKDKNTTKDLQMPSSTSTRKRKKKRKIQRSRSASQKGATSATRKTQDGKRSESEKPASRSSSATASRTPSATDKKIPPIKAPVWNAPPPKVKQAKSKIGSLENVTHKPKGGEKKVESVKLEWSAKSKVGSLDYATHKPGGGDKKIATQKLDFKNIQSKVGSKDNLKHKPGGGNAKINTEKLDFKAKAASKVGSMDNAKHKAGGGNVLIKTEKLQFKEKAQSKLLSRSGSEKGSSHGGSEGGSPVPPSSPAPPEMPPLTEDDNPSSQEDNKPQSVVNPDATNTSYNGGNVGPQRGFQDTSLEQERMTTNGSGPGDEHC